MNLVYENIRNKEDSQKLQKSYDMPLVSLAYQTLCKSPDEKQTTIQNIMKNDNQNLINQQREMDQDKPNLLDTLLSAQLTSPASSPQNNQSSCRTNQQSNDNSNELYQDKPQYKQNIQIITDDYEDEVIRIQLNDYINQPNKRLSENNCILVQENNKLQKFKTYDDSCTPVSTQTNIRRQKFLKQYEKEQQEQQIIVLQQQIQQQQFENQQLKRQMSRSILSNTTTLTTSTFDGLNIYNLSPKANEVNLNLKRINFMIKGENYQDANILIEELLQGDKTYLTNQILSQIYYSKGTISQKQDLLDIAVVYFQKSMDYDTSNLKAAYSLAACENQRGNFAKALDDYTYALEAEVSAQNSRKLNHVSSLSRLRTSNEFMRSFSNKDFQDRTSIRSPIPQMLKSQELLSERNLQSISRPTSAYGDSHTEIKKYLHQERTTQSPLSQINLQSHMNIRDSLQSPISFRADQNIIQDAIFTPNNHNKENSNTITIKLSDIEDDIKQQKIRDRQRSKENHQKVIQDYTQMIIRKKSPPHARNKENNNQAQSSQMIRRLYLNPSNKINYQQQNNRQKKTVKNIKQQQLEKLQQEHFKKEVMSSGEVSSITPMSTSQNNSRVSYNMQNQNSNSNISFKNMSSMSILKQINKVQKPSASTSLSKSQSSQIISSDNSKIQQNPMKSQNQGIKIQSQYLQKNFVRNNSKQNVNSKMFLKQSQNIQAKQNNKQVPQKQALQNKDIQVINVKIDEFLQSRRRINTVSPQIRVVNSNIKQQKTKDFQKSGLQPTMSETNSRPTSNIRNTSQNSNINKSYNAFTSKKVNNNKRTLSNNSNNTQNRKLFSPISIVQQNKTIKPQPKVNKILNTYDNRSQKQSQTKTVQNHQLLFTVNQSKGSNINRSVSPPQNNLMSPSQSNQKMFSPRNQQSQVFREGCSNKLFHKYLQMVNKKQYQDCMTIINQHIQRNSYKQLLKHQAYFLRGLINFRLKNTSLSLQDFQQSLSLKNDSPIAQIYIGICLIKERDYNTSLEYLQSYQQCYQNFTTQAVKTQDQSQQELVQFTLQDYILALYNKAKCTYKLLELRDSINQCEIILDRIDYDDPNSLIQTFRTVLLIAKCYLKLKDYENVHKVILSVETSQAAVRNFKYYTLKSQFYFISDENTQYYDPSLALESINEALLIKPNHEKSLLLRGYIYKRLLMYQEAICDFQNIQSEKLIKSKNLYYEIAICFHNIQFYEEALFYYQHQLSLIVNFAQMHINTNNDQNQQVQLFNKSQEKKKTNNSSKLAKYYSFQDQNCSDMSNSNNLHQTSAIRQTAEQSSINLIQNNQLYQKQQQQQFNDDNNSISTNNQQEQYKQTASQSMISQITTSNNCQSNNLDLLNDLSQRQFMLKLANKIMEIYQIIGREDEGQQFIRQLISQKEVMSKYPDLKFKLQMLVMTSSRNSMSVTINE